MTIPVNPAAMKIVAAQLLSKVFLPAPTLDQLLFGRPGKHIVLAGDDRFKTYRENEILYRVEQIIIEHIGVERAPRHIEILVDKTLQKALNNKVCIDLMLSFLECADGRKALRLIEGEGVDLHDMPLIKEIEKKGFKSAVVLEQLKSRVTLTPLGEMSPSALLGAIYAGNGKHRLFVSETEDMAGKVQSLHYCTGYPKGDPGRPQGLGQVFEELKTRGLPPWPTQDQKKNQPVVLEHSQLRAA